MKRRAPEQALQMTVARYLDVALPASACFTAFPAGGGGKMRGKILKSMGLVAGMPDLLIVDSGAALFLELKAPKGRLSMAQVATHARLRRCGARVATCRSLNDVEAALMDWGVPLRAYVSRETRSAA